MSYIDEAKIRSITLMRNNQLLRVPLENPDHQKPNYPSKYGGFSKFRPRLHRMR